MLGHVALVACADRHSISTWDVLTGRPMGPLQVLPLGATALDAVAVPVSPALASPHGLAVDVASSILYVCTPGARCVTVVALLGGEEDGTMLVTERVGASANATGRVIGTLGEGLLTAPVDVVRAYTCGSRREKLLCVARVGSLPRIWSDGRCPPRPGLRSRPRPVPAVCVCGVAA